MNFLSNRCMSQKLLKVKKSTLLIKHYSTHKRSPVAMKERLSCQSLESVMSWLPLHFLMWTMLPIWEHLSDASFLPMCSRDTAVSADTTHCTCVVLMSMELQRKWKHCKKGWLRKKSATSTIKSKATCTSGSKSISIFSAEQPLKSTRKSHKISSSLSTRTDSSLKIPWIRASARTAINS